MLNFKKNNMKLITKLFLLLVVFTLSCTNLEETIYDQIPESEFPENEAQAALKVIPTYKELADLFYVVSPL